MPPHQLYSHLQGFPAGTVTNLPARCYAWYIMPMNPSDFQSLPPGPERVTGSAVLVRLVEGIGFRFFWATEGLRDPDLAFRTEPEAMSIAELVGHVLDLAAWVSVVVGAILYTPNPGFIGNDSFTFRVNDGTTKVYPPNRNPGRGPCRPMRRHGAERGGAQ